MPVVVTDMKRHSQGQRQAEVRDRPIAGACRRSQRVFAAKVSAPPSSPPFSPAIFTKPPTAPRQRSSQSRRGEP